MPTPQEEENERQRLAELQRKEDEFNARIARRGDAFGAPHQAPSSPEFLTRRSAEFGGSSFVERPAGDRGPPPLVVGGAMCTVYRSAEHIRLQLGTRTVHMTAEEAYALVAAIEAAIG
jgi:hypothetical protein